MRVLPRWKLAGGGDQLDRALKQAHTELWRAAVAAEDDGIGRKPLIGVPWEVEEDGSVDSPGAGDGTTPR